MRLRKKLPQNALRAFGGGAAALCLLAPAAAQAPSLAMLDGLEKGEWALKFRDSTPARKICARTGRELLQLRHTATNCSRYVVEDGSNEVTVQYTCPGDGYGRTNIRRETKSLVQISGQGIKGDIPFQFSAEARRSGPCP
ncbi:hypothetical protein [Parerythrobacter lacustris]|uniref:DUF3617 family protein n=1 Tax=Parerythrobacter lacustris TaxID=2969984 RepID=A0ABT1XRI7_9SPHN|nr:hypothetical protein [Parerythrobacter lacustris]MCR2834273.1 hypothetical protein [Parerythrobacter lacustris]